MSPCPFEKDAQPRRLAAVRAAVLVLAAGATLGAHAAPLCVQQSQTPPGRLFNLSQWSIQLPSRCGDSSCQVPTNETAGFTDRYFSVDGSGSRMVFCAPGDGATTPHSHYPRSELRQELPGGDWSLNGGTHWMVASPTVHHVPASRPEVVIGQIHGNLLPGGPSTEFRQLLKLEWRDGAVDARIKLRNQSEASAGGAPLLTGLRQGTPLRFNISISGKVLTVGAWSAGTGWRNTTYDYGFMTYPYSYYFKAGAYCQFDEQVDSDGCMVEHTPPLLTWHD